MGSIVLRVIVTNNRNEEMMKGKKVMINQFIFVIFFCLVI